VHGALTCDLPIHHLCARTSCPLVPPEAVATSQSLAASSRRPRATCVHGMTPLRTYRTCVTTLRDLPGRVWGHFVGKVVVIVGFVASVLTIITFCTPRGGPASDVTMDIADGTTVARCTQLGGTAPDRKGQQLWIAVESGGDYLWQPAERGANDRWAAKLYIGSSSVPPNQQYGLQAFYIKDDQARFMAGIKPFGKRGESGYYLTSGPPPGGHKELTRTVTRSTTPDNSCPSS
jgi:hypothetical protein